VCQRVMDDFVKNDAIAASWYANSSCSQDWADEAHVTNGTMPQQCRQGFCSVVETLLSHPYCRHSWLHATEAPPSTTVHHTEHPAWEQALSRFCLSGKLGGFGALEVCADATVLQEATLSICGELETCATECSLPVIVGELFDVDSLLNATPAARDAICDGWSCVKGSSTCRYFSTAIGNLECYYCRCREEFALFTKQPSAKLQGNHTDELAMGHTNKSNLSSAGIEPASCQFSKCNGSSCPHQSAANCVYDHCVVSSSLKLLEGLPQDERRCIQRDLYATGSMNTGVGSWPTALLIIGVVASHLSMVSTLV